MDSSFFDYLERLELMGFFSAYPLVFAVVVVLAANLKKEISKKIPFLLPYAYALVGTFYLGMQLKNLYPDYSLAHIKESVQQPFLKIWALLSLLFWLPVLAKKPWWSFFHSLVFLYFLLRDLLQQSTHSFADRNIVRNEMKVYTDSLLLNAGTFLLVLLIFLLLNWYKKTKESASRS